jgi:hypothetical protein
MSAINGHFASTIPIQIFIKHRKDKASQPACPGATIAEMPLSEQTGNNDFLKTHFQEFHYPIIYFLTLHPVM